nr:MAG TPA: minor capsid protein [Caudoviricetes sp.]
MSSSSYWRRREEEALRHYKKQEAKYEKEIQRIYQDQLDAIQKEIDAFYGKYAKAENITIAEAKKRVSKADIAALERKAAKYVKDKDLSARANEEMRLYNATMRINRLEMLKADIGRETVSGHDELDKFMAEILKGRTEEELRRQAGILGKTIKNNARLARTIPNASFHNATFSDRIWMNQDLLKAELSKLLQTGLIQGKNPRVLARDLKKVFNVSTYNAERLMRTELARVQTEAQKQSFQHNGFEAYEFIANSNCCDICQGLDGKHFKVKDMMPGTNAPPMHPHCRCSVSVWEDSEEYEAWLDYLSKGGTTAAWNDHGKAEWENSYKKHGQNFDKWKKSNIKTNKTLVKTVAKGKGNDIINSEAAKGALTDKNDPLYVKRDAHAIKYYESVRRSKKSNIVKSIANNTGISENSINKVYDHVFINDHELYGEKRRFDPDYDMAESFRRLREGKNIQKHDLIMLKHERLEYELMKKKHLSYQEAHRLAEKKYNYQKALMEFKKKNNL